MARGRKTGGRKPGVQNKVTLTIKMQLLDALAKEGGVRYLRKLAREVPASFASLLGKIMPTQVVGDVNYRYVARIPAPEQNTEEWARKYAPLPARPQPTKH